MALEVLDFSFSPLPRMTIEQVCPFTPWMVFWRGPREPIPFARARGCRGADLGIWQKEIEHLRLVFWPLASAAAKAAMAGQVVERSLQIHADMRLAFASPAARIPARKLSNLFLPDACCKCVSLLVGD
jgi:hypothetical protein